MRAILFTIDDAYVMPFKVAWHSLVSTNSLPEDVQPFIVHEGTLSDGSMREIATFLGARDHEPVFIDAAGYMPTDLPLWPGDRLTRTSYLRLFTASMLPKTVSRVVYLDADGIALQSIRDLFDVPLSAPLAAADHLAPVQALRLFGPTGGRYLQSGVLIIDLEAWRREQVEATFRTILADRADWMSLHDQDVLNLAFEGRWPPLPVWFNTCRFVRSYAARSDVAANVRFLHLDGTTKPWTRYTRSWEYQAWYTAHEHALGQPFDTRTLLGSRLPAAWRHAKKTVAMGLGRSRIPELW